MIDFGKMKPQWRPSETELEPRDDDRSVEDLEVMDRQAEEVKAGFGGWNPKRPFMG
jgi:hypothetical protein